MQKFLIGFDKTDTKETTPRRFQYRSVMEVHHICHKGMIITAENLEKAIETYTQTYERCHGEVGY